MNRIIALLGIFSLLTIIPFSPSNGQLFTSDPEPDVAIPDDECFLDNNAEDDITVSGLPNNIGTNIFIGKVCFDITHPSVEEVEVFLKGPNGATIELVDGFGVEGANYVGTCFSPISDNRISDFGSPYTGTFEAEEFNGFNPFNGSDPNGTWTLLVCDDDDEFGSGTLDSWEISFVSGLCEPPDPIYIQLQPGKAKILWSKVEPADSYKIEYGPSGFDEGSGTVLFSTDTSILLSGLADNSDFAVYVSAVCDGDTTGSTLETFTSACQVFSGGYFDPFIRGGLLFECWREFYGRATLLAGPGEIASTRWTSDKFALDPSNTISAHINLFDDGIFDWLISPFIDISGNAYELTFDMALNEFQCRNCFSNGDTVSLFGDDTLALAISVDSGCSWMIMDIWDSSDFISPVSQGEKFDLSGYSGAVQFAFIANDGTDIQEPDEWTWSIDNFRVNVKGNCPYPYELGVMDHSLIGATLGWQDSSNATSWELEIGESGFLRTGIATDNADQKPFVWSLGSSGTDYEYYVRAKCGVDSFSNWSGPRSFCTLLDTFTEDFESSLFRQPDCWTIIESIVGITSMNSTLAPIVTFHAPNDAGLFFESSFLTEFYILATLPRLYYNPGSDYTIEFDAKGDFDLIMGYLTNPLDSGTFVPVDTFNVTSSFQTYTIVDTFSSLGQIAFNPVMTGMTFKETIIDNVHRTRVGGDPCVMNLNIGGTPASGTYNATSNIISDATIVGGNNVLYEAGNEVILLPAFEVEPGATFEASGGIPCPD